MMGVCLLLVGCGQAPPTESRFWEKPPWSEEGLRDLFGHGLVNWAQEASAFLHDLFLTIYWTLKAPENVVGRVVATIILIAVAFRFYQLYRNASYDPRGVMWVMMITLLKPVFVVGVGLLIFRALS